MNHVMHYAACPVCDASPLETVLQVNDHSVSKELFTVAECPSCRLRLTQGAPCETAIQRYYRSDSYISHTNTRKGIINSLYHIVRNYTLYSKVQLIKSLTHKQVGMHLDLGAGTGAFVHAMDNAGWNTIGLEPDSTARENAVKTYNVAVYPADDLFQLPDRSYDAITLWHVLEHIHRLHETVAKISSLLSSGGKLFIAVPNYTSNDAAHYQANWAAYDVPRHLYHFSPESMRRLLAKHGLRILAVKPMWFDSFYVSMLSEQYKGGNVFSGVVQGFLSNSNALFQKERCSSLIYIAERNS